MITLAGATEQKRDALRWHAVVRMWCNGRAELWLVLYVLAWVVALCVTHMLAR